MQLISVFLTITFSTSIFAVAASPQHLEGALLVDLTKGLTQNGKRPPANEVDEALRKALILLRFNPGTLAEYEALTQNESDGSAISATALQEAISDYEIIGNGKVVPTIISVYIAKSKVEVLSPRQRVLCYLMIKSSTRQLQKNQK